MNTSTCPHCGKSLRWKLLRGTPAPGERKFLPMRATLSCPFCQGELHPNPHPGSFKITVALIPFWLINLAGGLVDRKSPWYLGALGLSMLIGIAYLLYFHFKYLRGWPQFSATPSTHAKWLM